MECRDGREEDGVIGANKEMEEGLSDLDPFIEYL